MSGIGLDKLREYAQSGDVELRLVQTENPDDKPKIETREGTWHGRMIRNLKIDWEGDRSQKQVEYRGAHHEVLQALREAYGEEIGEKAFRAGGFGGQDQHGNWVVDSNHPINGRHIEKMLAFGDKEYAREVERNSGIGEWVATLRQDGRGIPQVMLGEKVSEPRGTVKREDAFQGIGGDLTASIDDWLRETTDKHGLWILDVGLDGGPGRIGIHVDRNNPDRLRLLGLDGDYNVNIAKDEFPNWLSQHLDGRTVSSMGLYRRAQEDTTSRLFERMNDVRPMLNFDELGGPGIKTWIPGAMRAIDESGQLLRRDFSVSGSTQELKQQIDLQLAQINKYLNSGDGTGSTQTTLDERYAFNNAFGKKIGPFLENTLGINDRKTFETIYTKLHYEANNFMGNLRARRGSLSEEQARDELGEQLGARLNQLLEDMDWDVVDRNKALREAGELFTGIMTELTQEFIDQRESIDTTLEPLRQDITRELEKQRVLLEAKSKSLEVGIQVEYSNDKHLETEGILKPEGSQGTGRSVRLTDKVEVAPLLLSFTKQGESIVATVPHFFPLQNTKYPGTGRETLSWKGLVQDHEKRLNQDESGVPGRGKEGDISRPIYERTSSGGIDLKIGDEEIPSLTELELETGWGDQSLLTREQYCGLTRFLNDGAFQDVYAQAVQRLYPPEEDGDPRETECRQVAIIIDIRDGEDGQKVFDITFRGTLPDGDLRYQALPQDGVLPEGAPTLEVEGEDLVLSLTMHVPFDQLQSGRPKVTIDEPVIQFIFAPEGELHLPQT
jgi:hypothetical protein